MKLSNDNNKISPRYINIASMIIFLALVVLFGIVFLNALTEFTI